MSNKFINFPRKAYGKMDFGNTVQSAQSSPFTEHENNGLRRPEANTRERGQGHGD